MGFIGRGLGAGAIAFGISGSAPMMPIAGPEAAPLKAEADHRRLLDLLGVASRRPDADGQNPRAPDAVNYDEAKASPCPTRRRSPPVNGKSGALGCLDFSKTRSTGGSR